MKKFNFFVPIEFEKAQTERNEENRYKNMIVRGVASTNDIDLDNQVIEPNGLILDTFLSTGLINYEHQSKRSPKAYIGEPIEAVVKDNKLFVKGKLWEKSQLARDLYDTVHVMKESGSKRRLAWSIEGMPLTKDPHNPNRITKALITHVALTFAPKNASTYAEFISKGQTTPPNQWDYEINVNENYLFKGIYGDCEYTLNKDFTITRQPLSEAVRKIKKAFEEGLIPEQVFQKAMCACSQTGQQLVDKETHGAALKGESLDEDLKILTIPIDSVNWLADEWENFKADTKKALRKTLHRLIEKDKHKN